MNALLPAASAPRLTPHPPPSLLLTVAPWRLSGVVLGVLMNDAAALAQLGDAAHAAPYKAPPKAPVLFVKPRNTLTAAGAVMHLPPGCDALEVGVNLGLVMGRSACRVNASAAMACVAAYALTVDISIPHASFYRPSVRLKALDGSCRIGPHVACNVSDDAIAFNIQVVIDGQCAQQASTAAYTRQAAQLIADVSEFMTLHPGDVLMLGTPAGAPLARAGQHVRACIDGVGEIEFAMEASA